MAVTLGQTTQMKHLHRETGAELLKGMMPHLSNYCKHKESTKKTQREP